MKNQFYSPGKLFRISFLFLLLFPALTWAQSGGRIAERIFAFKQKNSFAKETSLFSVASASGISIENVSKSLKQFTLLDVVSSGDILSKKPAFINFSIPIENGRRSFHVLLYKESISPNGFTLLTSDGKTVANANEAIVHYKGSIDGDPNSVAAFSFSANEVAGIINNASGNYVVGKLQDNSGKHIIYNDKEVFAKPVFDCAANTYIPLSPGTYFKGTESASALTTKCVNWYWEADYDVFVNKGSVANVNTFLQNVFNQVSTLYANDGISITLKTLYVWTAADPYTGPSTSNYLDQFGVNRTSFDGDLATLIGYNGGGGIAWINGLCNSQQKYKMAYCGISSGYSNVPSYSWTVECITHEQGHLLGSRHTHDCAWNGNNTKIDGCGDAAGYPSGTCALPSPALPPGGGTIMSYCHLTSAGINFNLGFGPQPKALMINNVNNASCLIACATGCTTPDQPASITGNGTVCANTSQTYTVTTVAGATSYTWTLPSGWSGTSTTNSITVTTGTSSGTISVTATNTCGNSAARTLAVTSTSVPAQPAVISGNMAVCSATSQTYSVAAVQSATSYTWTLPSGWSGTSVTNSINITSGASGGTISVKANNSCGSGTSRSLTVAITASGPSQPGIISGATTVCQGSAQTYSVPVVSGITYTWTLPAGWSGSSTTNSITVMAGNTAGSISVVAANGCGSSAARTLAVGISSVPGDAGTIIVSGGSANVCTGDIRTYTVPLVSGVSYSWIPPAGTTINSGQGTNSISLSFTAAFSAPATLNVSRTNSCGAGPASGISISKADLTKPGIIAISGGAAKVCPGDSRIYSVSPITGITYTWVAPAGAVINSGQGSNSISVSFNANFITSGTLSVTANNACGTSPARTLNILRYSPSAPGTITGATAVCAGATTTYSITAVSSADQYAWTVPTGASIIGQANGTSINILWGTRGGTITVKSINACGSSAGRTLKVTMNCSSGIVENKKSIAEEIFNVYPNPASDIAHVQFFAKENSIYTFTVTDIAGRKILTERQEAIAGNNIHLFNLVKFTRGSYFILIENKKERKVLKLSIQ